MLQHPSFEYVAATVRVNLARITPPNLSYDSLQFFDEEVRSCFSTCITVDISADHWQQAQLSLSFGGLGFRFQSLHSYASFISSLVSSGFGSASNHHLVSAISTFNALVFPSEVITVEPALFSPLSQHALSKKLDDNLFQSMLMTLLLRIRQGFFLLLHLMLVHGFRLSLL